MVPPNSGWGGITTPTPTARPAVGGSSTRAAFQRTGRAGQQLGDAAFKAAAKNQTRESRPEWAASAALHHLAVLQVRFDDFVDVVVVDIGVPGGLG